MEIDLVILVAKGEALHDQSSVQEIDDLSKQKRHVKSGEAETERRNQAATGTVKKAPETHIEQPLEENINRLQIEGDEARTVDEAISILSSKDAEVDKHPEKRLKAAYAAFEEVAMPRIKEENPTLRLSQLKQILRKEWMKSPENPLNQRQA
ncbi:hypothetical protein J6590_042187 [Homalodisca vitripennis]|nr:hypothetical protein J6590_042187 [Homalodisca vitripennis]